MMMAQYQLKRIEIIDESDLYVTIRIQSEKRGLAGLPGTASTSAPYLDLTFPRYSIGSCVTTRMGKISSR